jgi:hypothetical protein
VPAVCIRYDRGSERFFVLLAGDRLCHNRLPCAPTPDHHDPGSGMSAKLAF